jgi:hypothetical protein
VRSDKKGGFSLFGHLSGSVADSQALPLNRRIRGGASFSGNERDSVYFNQGGKDFVSISGITGLDDPGDGRSFAILDYDRDGWPDIVVASVTAPTLQLYRNQMGDKSSAGVRKNQMVAVRFVGGNHRAAPSKEWSNRDGYGAVLTVDLDGMTFAREHRAGEGLAAQNSATMLIGIGERRVAKSLTVRWPSGKTQDIGKVSANTLVTVYENPAHSPTGSAVVAKPYKVESIHPPKQRDLASLR